MRLISFKLFCINETYETSNQIQILTSSRSEAETLSRELDMRLYRTSVKDDLNVSVVFQHLAENYVNKVSKSRHK